MNKFVLISLLGSIVLSPLAGIAQTPSGPQLRHDILQECQRVIQSVPACNFTTGVQTGKGENICEQQPIDNLGVNPPGTQHCVTALFKNYPACLRGVMQKKPACIVGPVTDEEV
jgi:hypothetical protein